MSARRGPRCLAALLSTAAVVLVPGCAATVTGHGSLAADVRTPGGQPSDHGAPGSQPSGHPSAHPSGSAHPSATAGRTASTPPGQRGTGSTGSTGNGPICALFTAHELSLMFGQPASSSDKGDDTSCEFTGALNGSVLVNVYDFLNMKQEAARDPGGRSLTVAGHPAYQGKREIMVARTSSSSAAGLIIASNLFYDNEAKGNEVARLLLEKIVPKFAE